MIVNMKTGFSRTVVIGLACICGSVVAHSNLHSHELRRPLQAAAAEQQQASLPSDYVIGPDDKLPSSSGATSR